LKNQSHINDELTGVFGEEVYNVFQPFIQTAFQGEDVIFETNINLLNASFAFRINLLPQSLQNGKVNGIIIIMTDISSFKQNEMNVKEQLSNLAHVDRINLIGQMTAEIAHEINQPLSAIANYSIAGIHMQENGKLESESLQEILMEIDNQVHRASNIIHHLKKFSSKRELNFVNNNINNIVNDVFNLMLTDGSWHGVKVNSILDDAIPVMQLDGILIEQVLINILRNAIEAQCDVKLLEPSILVKTKFQGDNVLISIADNGPGIRFDKLESIFAPFYSTKKTGVGLGLSICKSIVESHSGKLWAKHNSDQGTTFYIQLPILLHYAINENEY